MHQKEKSISKALLHPIFTQGIQNVSERICVNAVTFCEKITACRSWAREGEVQNSCRKEDILRPIKIEA